MTLSVAACSWLAPGLHLYESLRASHVLHESAAEVGAMRFDRLQSARSKPAAAKVSTSRLRTAAHLPSALLSEAEPEPLALSKWPTL